MARGFRAGVLSVLSVLSAGFSGACAAPGDDASMLYAGSGSEPATPECHCPLGSVCHDVACMPNFPSCATTGSCLPDQQYCDDVEHFAVTDGIVVDLASGALWQRHAPTLRMTYSEAHEYCAGLDISGITGWRIPDIEALHSIVLNPGGLKACTPGYCCPAIDQSAFPGTPADLFWSSSPSGPTPDLVYCLQFADGRHSNWKTELTDSQYVRCTHDPQH